jgi:transcriptional regulator with XRE-family HTH domain
MPKPKYNRTYMREWRQKRGLSLRQLAARIEAAPGEELISFSSLARIEKGLQPYSQPILEGVALALDVPVTSLLSVNPNKEGEVISLLNKLDDKRLDEVLRVIRALAS